MTNQLAFIDYIVCILYFLFVASYGVWIYKRKKRKATDTKDFFLAEGSLTWWAIGASIIASNISAEQFIGMSGDGFFAGIAVAVETEHILNLKNNNIPIVVFDRICDDIKTAKVSTDDYTAGYKAAQHLIDNGCKKIAYLSISPTLSISNKRMNGYRQALADNYLLANQDYIVDCTLNEAYNNSIISNLLSSTDRPDAIIASVEKLTTNVYITCQKLGLKIPDDVAVISFSNLKTASILNPSLTTMTQPAFDIGRAAASLLFKSLEKKNFRLDGESEAFPSALTIRNSTCKKTS